MRSSLPRARSRRTRAEPAHRCRLQAAHPLPIHDRGSPELRARFHRVIVEVMVLVCVRMWRLTVMDELEEKRLGDVVRENISGLWLY